MISIYFSSWDETKDQKSWILFLDNEEEVYAIQRLDSPGLLPSYSDNTDSFLLITISTTFVQIEAF